MPNLGNFNNFNPFPALTNLQALHQLSNRSPPAPPTTNTQSPYKSPSTADNPTGITPLDLSSSGTPPLAKRIKLSPTSTETATRQQQQATSPNVTTTNNQLSASGFSTSSSSSTTSNGSEQAVNNQPSQKCQIKIDEINAWNVDEVCSFVETIDICAEYVKVSYRVKNSFNSGKTSLMPRCVSHNCKFSIFFFKFIISSLRIISRNCNFMFMH